MNIIEKLSLRVQKYRNYAKYNYYAAYFIYIVAFSASAASALLALNSNISRTELAIVSSIPGIAILLASTFKFSERASWHYEKKNRLNALLRLAETGSPDVNHIDIAEKWNSIDESMEKKWPSFGGISNLRIKN